MAEEGISIHSRSVLRVYLPNHEVIDLLLILKTLHMGFEGLESLFNCELGHDTVVLMVVTVV